MRDRKNAERRKLAESTMKDTLRPNIAVTAPPMPAPTASIVPHVDDISTFAGPSSSGLTMFGSAACDAGSKYAEPIEMRITPANAIGSVAGERARSGRRHAIVRPRSVAIISLRRSMRSIRCPACGVKRKIGSVCDSSTSETSVAECVSWSTRSASATVRNQSPPSEISVPA